MTTISIQTRATASLKQPILLATKYSNTVRGLVEKNRKIVGQNSFSAHHCKKDTSIAIVTNSV